MTDSSAGEVACELNSPTHSDVAYGPHERHRLDIWCASDDGARPLVVFIHGGGWNSGDKRDIPSKLLTTMLGQGISVASINYRFTKMALIPGPLHDAARAVQYLRSQATEWNIDSNRFAAYGVSAGGCTALWLAYHDDLIDCTHKEPMLRQSTRLSAAVAISPQTSLESEVITDWIGEEVLKHPMIGRAIGLKKREDLPRLLYEWREMLRECSPILHLSSDDPPAMLVYPRIETLPATSQGSAIHHAIFGAKLKQKADALRVPCELLIQESADLSKLNPHAYLFARLTLDTPLPSN